MKFSVSNDSAQRIINPDDDDDIFRLVDNAEQ